MDEVLANAVAGEKRPELIDKLLSQLEAVPTTSLNDDNVPPFADILCKWLRTSNIRVCIEVFFSTLPFPVR